ncbi:helix-turn-helix domain-containing protein [Halomonas sp. DP8Y7-3]|nr:helix-turn-helix domain-containing protein [Halomonas sp. DP8Y7-3]
MMETRAAGDGSLRVSIVLVPGMVPLDLVGPWQVLRSASIRQPFEIDFIGPRSQFDWMGPLSLSGIAPLPDSLGDCHLLLVPGQYRAAMEADAQDEVVRWLRSVAPQARAVMSVCSGTLLLAQAGLLDGRRCTTHHQLLDRLRCLAPRALVQQDCIFTEDRGLFTSAGISTGIDTMLHWLTRVVGHDIVVTVARDMVLYLRRSGQEPQLGVWLTGRNHVDQRIHRLQDRIAAAPADTWSMSLMARESAMGERHLRRRFVELTGMSALDYLARIRLQLARQLMQESSLSLAAIAEKVGVSDEHQLRRLWQRFEAGTPAQWRRQRQRDSSAQDACRVC